MAAEMMSILFEVSDGISAANTVCCTFTLKPPALPTAVTVSTIIPWMELLFTSRKVNGTPVAVAPTL